MNTTMKEGNGTGRWLHRLEQEAPVDEAKLSEAFAGGLSEWRSVSLSVTHLFVLCTAAQAVVRMPDCPPDFAAVLQDYLRHCAQDANLPEPMRQLLAQQMADGRQPA